VQPLSRGFHGLTRGVFLPHSLIPPDGLSSDSAVREPSSRRADGAADTCKNKTVNLLTFPSCQVCYKKNQNSCFMGCIVLEGYKKNRIQLTPGSPSLSLSLSLSHTHTHTHTHSPGPKRYGMTSLMLPQWLQIDKLKTKLILK